MKVFLGAIFFSLLAHGALLVSLKKSNTKEVSFEQMRSIINVKVVDSVKKGKGKKKEIFKNKKASPTGVKNKPSPLSKISPEYPYRSRILGEEGKVKVNVIIGTSGIVEVANIINSSGFERLDNSVLKALQDTKFNAARNYSEKFIKGALDFEFEFLLKNGEKSE